MVRNVCLFIKVIGGVREGIVVLFQSKNSFV